MDFFEVEIAGDGVATVIFDRPPVNAVTGKVFKEISEWTALLTADPSVRVTILTARPGAKAWCAGGDIKEFLDLDYHSRMERYATIDAHFPSLFSFDRPVLASINSHCIGGGLALASLCDVRFASDLSMFWLPEVDRGVVAGGGAFFNRLNVPQGFTRYMQYTGEKFSAAEMARVGFIDFVVPHDQLVDRVTAAARTIAEKSLPGLTLNKRALNQTEGLRWQDAYVLTHEDSAKLTESRDAKERISAFLKGRHQ
jgi:enoyl-CoA hydratase/carnithine racemase